jgi:prepilin-type N-terminal cleavage/methylation domain-containing protein
MQAWDWPLLPDSGAFAERRGLTLLELLVVLVILSIVATVAVNSLQPRVESTRFEQTRNLLGRIRTATIGADSARQTDGTPLISGFVADIGRLPKITSRPPGRADNGQELSELWEQESALARNFPFRFRSGPQSPVDYSQIQIPCGWRGPYLQLPMGSRQLRDGWGKPFEIERGSDGTVECLIWKPWGDFDSEMTCGLKSGKVNVSGTLNFGETPPSNVDVVLLGPDPDSSLSELRVFADEDSNPNTFTFSQVPVGLRALSVRYDEKQLTRYLQVPHQGLTLALELSEPAENQ